MHQLSRLLFSGLVALSLTVAAVPAQASWSVSIQNVMDLVYCLVGSGSCDGLAPASTVDITTDNQASYDEGYAQACADIGSTVDCNDVCGGGAEEDECGVCGGDGSSCLEGVCTPSNGGNDGSSCLEVGPEVCASRSYCGACKDTSYVISADDGTDCVMAGGEMVNGVCIGSCLWIGCFAEPVDVPGPGGMPLPQTLCTASGGGAEGPSSSCATLNLGGGWDEAAFCPPPPQPSLLCPCGCDQSEVMAADIDTLDNGAAFTEIERILTIQAEREHLVGYITEAMITHRLRLLDLATRKMGQTLPLPEPSTHALALRQRRLERPPVTNARLQVRTEMIAYGDYREQIQGKEKHYPASFRLWMEVKNLTGEPVELMPPTLDATVPLPVSRWFVEDTVGSPFEGRLAGGETKSILVIGDMGEPIKAGVEIDVNVRFDTFNIPIQMRTRDSSGSVEAITLRAD